MSCPNSLSCGETINGILFSSQWRNTVEQRRVVIIPKQKNYDENSLKNICKCKASEENMDAPPMSQLLFTCLTLYALLPKMDDQENEH